MLDRLRAALAEEGLFVVRPVSQAALDATGVPLSLAAELPGARSGLVIGDGGPGFFARFCRQADRSRPDPLDAYTRAVVPAALARALGSGPGLFVVRFPFADGPPWLPMQRLGRAAGLPTSGPLALQVHPRFGPWWAYRAFAVLAVELPDETALASPCDGCPAPCVRACPGEAVDPAGFHLDRCSAHRLAEPGCQLSCSARLRCPVGWAERYPAEQLAYHMAASLAQLRLRPD
jgi:hypothetical protein